MKFLLSSYTFSGFPLKETFLFTKELGLDGIELVLMPGHLLLGPKKIRALTEYYNVPILSVHQPMWHWPHTTKGMMGRLAKFSRALGARNVVIHLELLRFHNPRKIFPFIKLLEKKYGVNISLENSSPKRKSATWAQNAKQLANLAKKYNLNLTLDAPKMVISGTSPLSFFRENFTHIKNIHIHGLAGKDYHLPVFKSHYSYFSFLDALKNYSGFLTLEVYPSRLVDDLGVFVKNRREKIKEIIKRDVELIKDILII